VQYTSDKGRSPGAVVLVDDDAALRDAVTFSLESAGLRVLAFADAESALAAELPGDVCFVLDQRLPGLSGLEAFQALRSRGDRRPAIFITSQPKADLRRAAAAGGAPIVEKPLLGDVLLQAVRSVYARDGY
jgi:FixJ family two-component response regulator